jgi:hypothetical protein
MCNSTFKDTIRSERKAIYKQNINNKDTFRYFNMYTIKKNRRSLRKNYTHGRPQTFFHRREKIFQVARIPLFLAALGCPGGNSPLAPLRTPMVVLSP